MGLYFRFKTYKEEKELPKISPRLRAILWELAWFCKTKVFKDICITDLLRTQAEQDSLYFRHSKYQTKPWKSVHQYGRGADIRTYDCFSVQEIQTILRFLNSNWIYDPQRPQLKTAIYHNIGAGAHIHIQVIL